MDKRALAFALLLFGAPVWAGQAEISWQLPTENCDGSTIDPAGMQALELYVGTGNIPAQDVPCPDPDEPVDPPPTGGTVVDVVNLDPGQTSITLDLADGVTYFFRMRIRVNGEWSNLSNQVSKDLPFPVPTSPVLTIINL